MHPHRRRARPGPSSQGRLGPLLAASLTLGLLMAGCASTDGSGDASPASQVDEKYVPIAQRGDQADRSLGKLLADMDNAIRGWMEKTWTASSPRDQQKQDRLELYLESEARRHQAELLEQLETGPARNRIVAATALGFTRDPAVLSPLLNALEDPEPGVVQNALIGLSLLQSPDTPLEPVIELMRYAEEPSLRGSAAYCLRCLLEIGAEGGAPADAARAGVVDPDPIVRSQSALVLALTEDPGAVDSLALLLGDDVVLVASAAARSLAHLGAAVDEQKGPCARVLTDALEDEEDDLRVQLLLRNLVALAQRNYGEDRQAWSDWSHRLP